MSDKLKDMNIIFTKSSPSERGTKYNCETCGKEFTKFKKSHYYCSGKCNPSVANKVEHSFDRSYMLNYNDVVGRDRKPSTIQIQNILV